MGVRMGALRGVAVCGGDRDRSVGVVVVAVKPAKTSVGA